ncbi:hypothetical protein ACHAPX_002214 [Trichoderma viride]
MSYRVTQRCGLTAQKSWLFSPQFLAAQSRALHTSRAAYQTKAAAPTRAVAPTVNKSFRPTSKPQKQKPINAAINPPASTRPPPLEAVEPQSSKIKYYFKLGKAYVIFFKDGVKAIMANRRLVNEKVKALPNEERPSMFKPHHIPSTFSRADWVLLWRTRHDLMRLPLFALFFLIAEDLTPILVIFLPGILPYTCRFPRLLSITREKAEQRHKAAFNELESQHPQGALSPGLTKVVAHRHLLKSLDLSGRMWDRLGFTPPGMWAIKGRLRMIFLEIDDQRLLQDGGPLGLEIEELRLACSDRGINILGKSETQLQTKLGDWLRLTAAEDLGERRRRMAALLLTRPENWPQQRDFAVPEWEL